VTNIGYIQVVRHCNQNCGFCSNPTTPYTHSFQSIRALIDDFVARGYYGIILTGGEPTLSPILPEVIRYAASTKLHVRLITNGQKLANSEYAQELAKAGLAHAHVSIYSVRPELEDWLRNANGSLERAFAALENLHAAGVTLNINSVINRFNCDHLHENVQYEVRHFPFVRHYVWNNLDPSLGRAESNTFFTPRLADLELSLHRAMKLLDDAKCTFRVERVPLCYMADYAHASTETRKIVKEEERIVHFLDDKGTVRQTYWGHLYSAACSECSLRPICGGLYDKGNAYDPAELHPVFLDPRPIIERIRTDEASDPSIRGANKAGASVAYEGP
jgi:MoaA/NifB/PqqE/SkfB family radical SAM enzyme